MSHIITTEHDEHTLSILQRMADGGNCSKEVIVESVVRQSMDAFAQLERDIQEARDDVKAGRCYTQEQVIEMLNRLDADAS